MVFCTVGNGHAVCSECIFKCSKYVASPSKHTMNKWPVKGSDKHQTSDRGSQHSVENVDSKQKVKRSLQTPRRSRRSSVFPNKRVLRRGSPLASRSFQLPAPPVGILYGGINHSNLCWKCFTFSLFSRTGRFLPWAALPLSSPNRA